MLICVDNGFSLSCRHWQVVDRVDLSIKRTLSYHKAHLAQTHEGSLKFWLGKCFLVHVCQFYFEEWPTNIKQLLDEVEHDIMNYQNRGLCYLRQIIQTRGFDNSWYHATTEFNNCFIIHFLNNRQKKAFSHSVSEENNPRGLITRQTLNLTSSQAIVNWFSMLSTNQIFRSESDV